MRVEPITRSNAELGATSFVRIVFKAFEHKLPYNHAGIKPFNGKIANSQKVKIDALATWANTPFVDYNIIQVGKCYRMEPKTKVKSCSKCLTGRGSMSCRFKFCIKCCAEHVISSETCDVCKLASHSKKAKEMLAQRMDGEDEDYNPEESEGEDENSDSDSDISDMSDSEIMHLNREKRASEKEHRDNGGEKNNDSGNDSSDDDSSDDDSSEDDSSDN